LLGRPSYSPDGHFVITASQDGKVIIWDADYRDFVAYACERMGKVRDFTDDERQRFGITDDAPTCPQFAG
jgi:hypothetical protein